MTRKFAICLIGAALVATPLAAQDAASEVEQTIDPALEVGQDIVVTGELGEMHEQARDQAREITQPVGSVAAPLARMQAPVCPGVFGAETQTAYQIIGRIRSNTERIGHEVIRGDTCTANVVVAFVDDPQAEFELLREARHYLVDGLDFWDAKRVRETEGPILAWNVTAMLSRDGIASNGGRPPTFSSTAVSRTELGVREDIAVSVVMIRRDAVAGLDTIAIADYVTMRALAQTEQPEGATALGTILELFNPAVEAPPYRLTSFDEAYLTSLYRQQANTPSRLALRDVGTLMERAEQ